MENKDQLALRVLASRFFWRSAEISNFPLYVGYEEQKRHDHDIESIRGRKTNRWMKEWKEESLWGNGQNEDP